MEKTDTYELTYTEGFLEQLEKHENSGQKDVLKKIEKLFSEIEIEFFARCVASYLDGTLSISEFASNTNQKIYELLELTQDEIDLVENLYLRGCN